jgi:ribose transport system substrate-binding protein
MKKLVSILMAVVMVLSMAGCQGKSSAGTTEAGQETQTQKKASTEEYAVIMSLHQLEFFDALKAGVNDAAKDLGAKWYFAGPQDLAPDKVSEAIDQAVAKKVTGIVLHGQFQETGAAIDNAIAAGIPVICVNTDIESNRLSFIGCDPYNTGVEMAKQMAKEINGKGKIIISSFLSGGQPSAIANLKGCRDELAKNWPDIKIVAEVDDKADEATAATAIGAALQANQDITGIIGMQAPSAVGAASAVRESGMKGIKIVGRDRDSATLELIENGEVAASFAQNSYVEGYTAVNWLHQYVNGKLKVTKNYLEAKINPIPPIVDSGSIIIRKDNVNQFKEKYTYDK